MRVLLAEDHGVLRAALRAQLGHDGIEVVGCSCDGAEAVEMAVALKPDVVCTDLTMPRLSGVEVIRRIRAHLPGCRVLVYTGSANEDDLIDALLAGACGYVLKSAPTDRLVAALRAAAEGDAVMSELVATKLRHRLQRFERPSSPGSTPADLSEREREVLRLVAAGRDNAAIAAELFISQATVKNHVSHIFAKLDVHNRVQAAVEAVRHGLV